MYRREGTVHKKKIKKKKIRPAECDMQEEEEVNGHKAEMVGGEEERWLDDGRKCDDDY